MSYGDHSVFTDRQVAANAPEQSNPWTQFVQSINAPPERTAATSGKTVLAESTSGALTGPQWDEMVRQYPGFQKFWPLRPGSPGTMVVLPRSGDVIVVPPLPE